MLSVFRRLAGRFLNGPDVRTGRASSGPSPVEPTPVLPFQALEESLASMTAAELTAWENREVPTIGRSSDHSEARADERQDVTTSLNFPLHWTSAVQSWNYLFDFSVACELLAPRPDDLVLDFAAGTCWASELLNRIGVRTVAMDLSVEMMRRGRERLAADNRLILRDDAAFVAARGQALPFTDESFDASALHERVAPRPVIRRSPPRNPSGAQARRESRLLRTGDGSRRPAAVTVPDEGREHHREECRAATRSQAGDGSRLQQDAGSAPAVVRRVCLRVQPEDPRTRFG